MFKISSGTKNEKGCLILWKSITKRGFYPEGLSSGGAFVRRGFCPLGFYPRGFYPRPINNNVVIYLPQWATLNFVADAYRRLYSLNFEMLLRNTYNKRMQKKTISKKKLTEHKRNNFEMLCFIRRGKIINLSIGLQWNKDRCLNKWVLSFHNKCHANVLAAEIMKWIITKHSWSSCFNRSR